jgi:hypothetical protein
MDMRDKFDAQLVCGCTQQLKAEVEAEAARDGLSIADYVRVCVLRNLRARKVEAEHAA